MHSKGNSLAVLSAATIILSALLLSSRSKDEPPSATGLLEWDRLELIAETNEPILEQVASEGEQLPANAVILGLGLVISTLAKNQFQAMQMTFFFFLPSILLSGFMFPFEGMPTAARYIAELLPLTHFLRLIRGIMLRGVK